MKISAKVTMLPIALISLVLVLSIDALPVPLSKENISIPDLPRPPAANEVPYSNDLPRPLAASEALNSNDLPGPLAAIEAIVEALDAVEKNGPFGVRKQTVVDWDSKLVAKSRGTDGGKFECYDSEYKFEKAYEKYCGFFVRLVKRIDENIDCENTYYVESVPELDHMENDLEVHEDLSEEYQTISIQCKCFTPLCNKEGTLNECMKNAKEKNSVSNNFKNMSEYEVLLKCIAKQSQPNSKYFMDEAKDFEFNNAPMAPLKNDATNDFMCYSGNETVQGLEKYCTTTLRAVKKVNEKIDCTKTHFMRRKPTFFRTGDAAKDLEILEERQKEYQSISIQCKCYTSLCNTNENLKKCMLDAVAKDSVRDDFKQNDDLHAILKCYSGNSDTMAQPEMLLSNDKIAFNSIKNDKQMADKWSSSEPMMNKESEVRSETTIEDKNASEASTRSSDASSTMMI